MTTLADFLKEQAAQERAEAPLRQAKLAEWLAAVEHLFQQMETWFRESDVENVLQLKRTSIEIGEAGLGVYQAPALAIKLRDRFLDIITGGRNTFGSINREDTGQPARIEGSVDIVQRGVKHMIYRVPDAGDPEWFLVDHTDYLARPLNRKEFEKIMLSLLQ